MKRRGAKESEKESEWSQMAVEPRKCWGQRREIPAPSHPRLLHE